MENIMNDALEILNDLEDIINTHPDWSAQVDLIEKIVNYLAQKRTEFEPSCGDCAG
jgi:hypothetical protein